MCWAMVFIEKALTTPLAVAPPMKGRVSAFLYVATARFSMPAAVCSAMMSVEALAANAGAPARAAMPTAATPATARPVGERKERSLRPSKRASWAAST